MKKLLLIPIVLCASLCCAGAASSAASVARTQDPVAAIRQRYAGVNRGIKKYRTVKKELLGFSTEGGELVAFFDGPEVVKIEARHQGETGRSYEEYYFQDEQLIFVFQRRDDYDEPMSGRIVKSTENRHYFKGGRLIRWIAGRGRRVAPGGEEYLEAQSRYLDHAKLFTQGARSTQPVIEAPLPNS